MNSYVCASLDAMGNCTDWVQTWSMVALSYDDAARIASIIIGCWALAFGIRVVFRFILNRL